MASEEKVDSGRLRSLVNTRKVRRTRADPGTRIDLALFGRIGLGELLDATTWTTTTTTTTTTTYGARFKNPLIREVRVRKRYTFPLNIRVLEEERIQRPQQIEG